MIASLTIEPTGDSGGHCDCCGKESRTVCGFVNGSSKTVAAYFVHWTRGALEHHPNFDFLIGTWGDDAINDRALVSWQYNVHSRSFMIIDGANRPAATSPLCHHALRRDEVLADPELLARAKELLDSVWLQDPRIRELTEARDA